MNILEVWKEKNGIENDFVDSEVDINKIESEIESPKVEYKRCGGGRDQGNDEDKDTDGCCKNNP